jgi:hypothetical protein
MLRCVSHKLPCVIGSLFVDGIVGIVGVVIVCQEGNHLVVCIDAGRTVRGQQFVPVTVVRLVVRTLMFSVRNTISHVFEAFVCVCVCFASTGSVRSYPSVFPSAAHPFVRVQARASTLDQPARTEWRKYFKGRVRPLAPHANLSFGSVGLQSLEIARITQKQMLAVRMVRCAVMCCAL